MRQWNKLHVGAQDEEKVGFTIVGNCTVFKI